MKSKFFSFILFFSTILYFCQGNTSFSQSNKEISAVLDTVYQNDQKFRREIINISKKFGENSEQYQKQIQLIRSNDSLNLVKVKKILDERGWLGTDEIGYQGNSTLFLVIQHADPKSQEHYLPIMREAVKSGKANAGSLAYLEDRIELRKGGKQIYGTQIGKDRATGQYFVLPLLDPEKVDERRKQMGLGSLKAYVANWGIEWEMKVPNSRN